MDDTPLDQLDAENDAWGHDNNFATLDTSHAFFGETKKVEINFGGTSW